MIRGNNITTKGVKNILTCIPDIELLSLGQVQTTILNKNHQFSAAASRFPSVYRGHRTKSELRKLLPPSDRICICIY